MTKQFTFNTQRQYSPEGQIIKVIYDGNNTDQPSTVQSSVMTLYDLGSYEWLSEKDFQKKWEA